MAQAAGGGKAASEAQSDEQAQGTRRRLTRHSAARSRTATQPGATAQDAQAARQSASASASESRAPRARHRPVYHCRLERGGRRNGRLVAQYREQMDTVRSETQHEGLRQTCLERTQSRAGRAKNAGHHRVVSGDVHKQVRQLAEPPVSYALHAQLIPLLSRAGGPESRGHAGEPLRELNARLRAPLFEPGGGRPGCVRDSSSQLKQQAKELAEVFQRSSANVEGRNGDLSLRHDQLRGPDRPESASV